MTHKEPIRSACAKNLKRLTPDEYLAVMALYEWLRYGGKHPCEPEGGSGK